MFKAYHHRDMIARVDTRTWLLGAKHPPGNTCWVRSVASPLSKAAQVTRDTRTCDPVACLAGSSWAFFYAGTIIVCRNNDKTDPDSSRA